MAVLRFRWKDSSRGIQLPQQSVDDRPGVQQLGVGSQECRSSALRACTRQVLCDGQVSPRGRYQGTGPIGQYKRQMKLAASMAPAKYIERRSLKGMPRPNDGYLIGIVNKMMTAVVGSLSSSLSTPSCENISWR
jgi:hypothetical protein